MFSKVPSLTVSGGGGGGGGSAGNATNLMRKATPVASGGMPMAKKW